jgi:hypothetical protein
MSADNEAMVIRRRLDEIEEILDGFRDISPGGNPTKLVQLATAPATAGVFGAVTSLNPGGTQTEGSAVTTGAASPINFQAGSVGPDMPQSGMVVLATLVGSRWIYFY